MDTANAGFHRPGVTTYLDELSVQSVQEAVENNQSLPLEGTCGSQRHARRHAFVNQAAGKQLEGVMPDSKGKVATMIHTEAAAYAEMYFGPGASARGSFSSSRLARAWAP